MPTTYATFSGKYAVTSLWLLCVASLFVLVKTSFPRPNNPRSTHALISALHSIENCCRIKLPQKNFFGIKWLCNPGRVWGPCLLQSFTSYQYHMTEDNLFYATWNGAILCATKWNNFRDGALQRSNGMKWRQTSGSSLTSGCRHYRPRGRKSECPSYFLGMAATMAADNGSRQCLQKGVFLCFLMFFRFSLNIYKRGIRENPCDLWSRKISVISVISVRGIKKRG